MFRVSAISTVIIITCIPVHPQEIMESNTTCTSSSNQHQINKQWVKATLIVTSRASIAQSLSNLWTSKSLPTKRSWTKSAKVGESIDKRHRFSAQNWKQIKIWCSWSSSFSFNQKNTRSSFEGWKTLPQPAMIYSPRVMHKSQILSSQSTRIQCLLHCHHSILIKKHYLQATATCSR